MKKEIDCQVFEDQLDALMAGTLPAEGMAQLRLHASACPECGMQLRVQEHLALPPLKELEGAVPEEMLAGMWSEVRSTLAGRPVETGGRSWTHGRHLRGSPPGREAAREKRSGSHGFGWMIPTMAAATVILLLGTGYLFAEVSRLKSREAALAQQVSEQQQWLAELGSGAATDPVVRTAALAGRNPLARALSRQESVTISALQEMLRNLPGSRTLLEATEAEDLMSNPSTLAPPLWRGILGQMDVRDGVRVDDLLEVLESLDLSPTLTVPTSDLIELLS